MTDMGNAESERQARSLSAALNAATTGFLIFDPNGAPVHANAAARALLPFLADTDQRPPDLEGVAALLPGLDLSGTEPSDCRVGPRWLRCAPHRTGDGGTTVELTDITDLKQSEGTLVNARDMALLADRAKSEFLANMTHELRTPLNAVIGFAEVLRDELLGPLGSSAYKDFVSDIHNSGRHLLAIIDDILDLSKIEVGHRALNAEAIDVTSMISSAVRMIRHRAEEAELTLIIPPEDDLPLLMGEERSIKQILLNLLSNAIKFTDAGGTITVAVARDPKGGLDLSVTDTGIGIASGDQERIFTPFVQVETGRPVQSHGAGLGLSLVKSLAEMHEATIVLVSELGQGTTVTIHFPETALVQRQPGKVP